MAHSSCQSNSRGNDFSPRSPDYIPQIFVQLVVTIPSRRIPDHLRHLHWYKASDKVFGVEVLTVRDLDLIYECPGMIVDDTFLLNCSFHELTELLLI